MTERPVANLHEASVAAFGREWTDFDQSELATVELHRMFEEYFRVFPWERLPPDAEGADIGCGSGRWARLVAPKVGKLHVVDASAEALATARRNLAGRDDVAFHHASLDRLPLEAGSLDFAYSLGVLHHLPDTAAAMADCARVLKPGGPLLVYLYYALEDRPGWYRALWVASDAARRAISALPPRLRGLVCDAAALLVYWPLARLARLVEWLGPSVQGLPLSMYRGRSLYTMRTDARDRFGTPLEKRFTRHEIRAMMESAGLTDVRFSDRPPFWCAVGLKRS